MTTTYRRTRQLYASQADFHAYRNSLILLPGELGIEADRGNRIKVGDGESAYDNLPYINVIYPMPEHYGAKGDGVADDTAALQAWFDAINKIIGVKSTGVGAASPGAVYKVTGTLYFPSAVIYWNGAWLWLVCDDWTALGYGTHKSSSYFDAACMLPRSAWMTGGNPYPDDLTCNFFWHDLNVYLDRQTETLSPSYPFRLYNITRGGLKNCWLETPSANGVVQHAWDLYAHCKNFVFDGGGVFLRAYNAGGGLWIRNFDTQSGHETENIKVLNGIYSVATDDECIAAWSHNVGGGEVWNTQFANLTLESFTSGRLLTLQNLQPSVTPDTSLSAHQVVNVSGLARSMMTGGVGIKIRDMAADLINVKVQIQGYNGNYSSTERAFYIQNANTADGLPIRSTLTNCRVLLTAAVGTSSDIIAFDADFPAGGVTRTMSLVNCGCEATGNNYFHTGIRNAHEVIGGNFLNCLNGSIKSRRLEGCTIEGAITNCYHIRGIKQVINRNVTGFLVQDDETLVESLLNLQNWEVDFQDGAASRPIYANLTTPFEIVIQNMFVKQGASASFTNANPYWPNAFVLSARNVHFISSAGVITPYEYTPNYDSLPTKTTERRKPYVSLNATTDASADAKYAGKIVSYYGSGDYTFTLPNATAMGTAYGAEIVFEQRGTGTLTIAAASGGTLIKRGYHDAIIPYGCRATAHYYGTGSWLLSGILLPQDDTWSADGFTYPTRALGHVGNYAAPADLASAAKLSDLKTLANCIITMAIDLKNRGHLWYPG